MVTANRSGRHGSRSQGRYVVRYQPRPSYRHRQPAGDYWTATWRTIDGPYATTDSCIHHHTSQRAANTCAAKICRNRNRASRVAS